MPIRRITSPRANASNMRYSLRARLDSKILSDRDCPVPDYIRASAEEAAAMSPHRSARIPVWKCGAYNGDPATGPTSLMRPASAADRRIGCRKSCIGSLAPEPTCFEIDQPGAPLPIAAKSTDGQSANSTSRPSIRMSQCSMSVVRRVIARVRSYLRLCLTCCSSGMRITRSGHLA